MRSIRQTTINLGAMLLLGLALVFLVYGTFSLRSSMRKLDAAVAAEKTAHFLADDMREASDFLTDEARLFAVTQGVEDLRLYWIEADVTKRREKSILGLTAMGSTAEEARLLALAKERSDFLMNDEILSMRLVAEAIGLPRSGMPARVAATGLSPADEALPPEGKLDRARDLVFGPAYMEQKAAIMEAIDHFDVLSRSRMASETAKAHELSERSFLLVICLCVLCLAGAVLFLAIYYRQIALPIEGYTRALAGLGEEKAAPLLPSLVPSGTRELATLAETFNRRGLEVMEFQKALRDSEARMRAHREMMPLGEIEVDRGRRICSWNPAAERIFGFSEAEALGADLLDLIVPESARAEVLGVIRALTAGTQIDRHVNANRRKDGREIHCEWFNTPLFDSEGAWFGWAAIVRDITREREEQEKILYLSRHDSLTGLLNRRYLLERLEETRARAHRTGTPYTVIMVDIDRFKAFNDLHGHECGDLVLRSAANAMNRSLRSTDFVGRWGGEEFLIILPETDLAGGFDLGERIRQEVAGSPVEYRGETLHVTVTVGVAACLDADEAIDDNVRRADSALLEGKAQGRNRTVAAPGA
jgi:diguanylate cyclase (GGDEF)-like protein/PAS domain S-box-containing protein